VPLKYIDFDILNKFLMYLEYQNQYTSMAQHKKSPVDNLNSFIYKKENASNTFSNTLFY